MRYTLNGYTVNSPTLFSQWINVNLITLGDILINVTPRNLKAFLNTMSRITPLNYNCLTENTSYQDLINTTDNCISEQSISFVKNYFEILGFDFRYDDLGAITNSQGYELDQFLKSTYTSNIVQIEEILTPDINSTSQSDSEQEQIVIPNEDIPIQPEIEEPFPQTMIVNEQDYLDGKYNLRCYLEPLNNVNFSFDYRQLRDGNISVKYYNFRNKFRTGDIFVEALSMYSSFDLNNFIKALSTTLAQLTLKRTDSLTHYFDVKKSLKNTLFIFKLSTQFRTNILLNNQSSYPNAGESIIIPDENYIDMFPTEFSTSDASYLLLLYRISLYVNSLDSTTYKQHIHYLFQILITMTILDTDGLLDENSLIEPSDLILNTLHTISISKRSNRLIFSVAESTYNSTFPQFSQDMTQKQCILYIRNYLSKMLLNLVPSPSILQIKDTKIIVDFNFTDSYFSITKQKIYLIVLLYFYSLVN